MIGSSQSKGLNFLDFRDLSIFAQIGNHLVEFFGIEFIGINDFAA
jgi:hypothetical protein